MLVAPRVAAAGDAGVTACGVAVVGVASRWTRASTPAAKPADGTAAGARQEDVLGDLGERRNLVATWRARLEVVERTGAFGTSEQLERQLAGDLVQIVARHRRHRTATPCASRSLRRPRRTRVFAVPSGTPVAVLSSAVVSP